MLFNSFRFLLFFPIVTLLYFALPHRIRWVLLLAASCIFYMAFKPVYILILAYTIAVDYLAGIYIEQVQGKKRKYGLILSLVSNIGVLAFFKYFNFLNDNLSWLVHILHAPLSFSDLKILLPIGLSFHTFQAMSYTLEIYRGNQKAERHFGIFALYVMFYPQLVAGPIERPQNLLHQFREKHPFNYTRVSDGLKLMLWGFFKKVVIADRLGWYVDQVYNDPAHHHGMPVILATLFFAFQIYCDFSGYSDIAIGAAEVMGFRLMDNFNRPYFSSSVAEFWKRWHISLSSWFRDYFYIPLGGKRVPLPRWWLNLFLTFLVSGLWHGANWTFVIWGAMNGLFVITGTWLQRYKNKFPAFMRWRVINIVTTFILIDFSWIFFRASTFKNAITIVKNIFDFSTGGWNWQLLDNFNLSICFISIVFMELIHYMNRHDKMRHFFSDKPVLVRWFTYSFILWAIWIFGVFGERQFIYFQF